MIKRSQTIFLVVIILALVQMACSMPGPQSPAKTPDFITPTIGPAVITATNGAPTQAAPTATNTNTPTAPTATTTPDKSNNNSSTGSCTLLATFVTDVTIPDDTRFSPGAAFTKTWRVRNDGTCTWGPNRALHALAFTGGSRLGAPDQVALSANVGPGQSVDISVNMVAPDSAGVYTSEWMFRVDGISGVGPLLGLGSGKVAPVYARIVVGATPTPPSTAATRIYFEAGATGATVEGSVKANNSRSYLLGAAKDQLLMAGISTAANGMRMEIVEASTGRLLSGVNGTSTQVFLPATGDYLIKIIAGSTDANFTLGVNIPSRITFEAGVDTANLDGKITNHQAVMYLVRALAGQTMKVKVTSPTANGIALTIYGIDDGQPLVRADFGLTEWSGDLNNTQDYMIMVVPSVDSTTFNLTVTIN